MGGWAAMARLLTYLSELCECPSAMSAAGIVKQRALETHETKVFDDQNPKYAPGQPCG